MILYSLQHPLSVVVSLRHEHLDVLAQVSAALRAQSLPKRHWRLIVVDDRPEPGNGLDEWFSWHPHVTIVRMTQIGAMPPEMRALTSCRTDLSVLVRAHTILAPDFLEQAVEIAQAHPLVGLFGGSVEGRCQSFRATWQTPFLDAFGVRSHAEPVLAYEAERGTMPSANAFIVRRTHLHQLGEVIARHRFFREKGFHRHAREFDFCAALARSVVQAGGSLGVFPQLQATRLFSKEELNDKAVALRLRQDAFSRIIERFVWTGMLPQAESSSVLQRATESWLRLWELGRSPRLRRANREGTQAGLRLALNHTMRVAQAPAKRKSVELPTATSVAS